MGSCRPAGSFPPLGPDRPRLPEGQDRGSGSRHPSASRQARARLAREHKHDRAGELAGELKLSRTRCLVCRAARKPEGVRLTNGCAGDCAVSFCQLRKSRRVSSGLLCTTTKSFIDQGSGAPSFCSSVTSPACGNRSTSQRRALHMLLDAGIHVIPGLRARDKRVHRRPINRWVVQTCRL